MKRRKRNGGGTYTLNRLKYFFLITDVGFVIYWLITIFHMIPQEYLFKDYEDPILVAWNWSFLPLDLLISLTGFLSLYLHSKQNIFGATLHFYH